MTLNDLERLFHVKIRYRPALLESERLNVKKIIQHLRFCGVQCCIKYILKVFQLQNTNYIFK